MRVTRTVACLVLMLALGSCSFSYPVIAWFKDGALVFIVDGEEDEEWCWSHFEVVDHAGRLAWSFSAFDVADDKRCWTGVLSYGQAPPGAKIEKQPQPLQLGRIYALNGSAHGSLHGAFYLYEGGGRITVQNMNSDIPRVREIERRREELRRAERAITE